MLSCGHVGFWPGEGGAELDTKHWVYAVFQTTTSRKIPSIYVAFRKFIRGISRGFVRGSPGRRAGDPVEVKAGSARQGRGAKSPL